MKRSIALLALAALPALAQQPSTDEINARLEILAAQRNEAQNNVAVIAARAHAEKSAMQVEIDKLKKAAEACKPKEEKPK